MILYCLPGLFHFSTPVYVIKDKDELIALLNQFLLNSSFYTETSVSAGQFVKDNTGAVTKILSYIQEKRLLTN